MPSTEPRPVTLSVSKLLAALDAAAKGVEDARAQVRAAKAAREKGPSLATRILRAISGSGDRKVL